MRQHEEKASPDETALFCPCYADAGVYITIHLLIETESLNYAAHLEATKDYHFRADQSSNVASHELKHTTLSEGTTVCFMRTKHVRCECKP